MTSLFHNESTFFITKEAPKLTCVSLWGRGLGTQELSGMFKLMGRMPARRSIYVWECVYTYMYIYIYIYK